MSSLTLRPLPSRTLFFALTVTPFTKALLSDSGFDMEAEASSFQTVKRKARKQPLSRPLQSHLRLNSRPALSKSAPRPVKRSRIPDLAGKTASTHLLGWLPRLRVVPLLYAIYYISRERVQLSLLADDTALCFGSTQFIYRRTVIYEALESGITGGRSRSMGVKVQQCNLLTEPAAPHAL